MPRISVTMLFIFSLAAAPLFGSHARQVVTVAFFSENLQVSYSMDMVLPGRVPLEEKKMVAFFHQLEKTNYALLLHDLLEKKEQFRLNDWLFYELMRISLEKIYSGKSELERELTSWFLLAKAGYDTRLTYLGNRVFVYVHTEDEIFEVPMIEDAGRSFANLTSIHQGVRSQNALYLLNFTANPGGRAFSFYLAEIPRLRPRLQEKSFSFAYNGWSYQLQVKVDLTVVEIMKNYPLFSESRYLEAPLSPTLANSLLPQLREIIKGRSQQEAVELLTTFTRSSFRYKEDKEHFGYSKPMIADEVFYYPYSDCEDRAALLYCLVKELLDLPMIVIAYPDHLTIAIALDKGTGDAVRYKGTDYWICDPTGPVDSTEIGQAPIGYEEVEFEIIGRYK
jgi:hypothetical protein